MNQAQQQGRDERSVVVGRKDPVNRITDRFAARGGGSKDIDRAGPQHLGSAVSQERRDLSEVRPVVLRRVLKDAVNVLFAMPEGASFRGKLRAGKVLSSLHYDFDGLKAQGVLLGAVEDEVVGVGTQGGASAQLQLKDVFAALREAGFKVVPADAQGATPAESGELEQLRRELAELKAKQQGEEPKERAKR